MLPDLLDSRQIVTQLNLEKIIQILKNPQVHPREALSLVGIGFVLALILLTLVALFFVKTPEEEQGKKRKIMSKEHKIGIALAAIEVSSVVVIIAVTALFAYVDQPNYCRSCHEMENAFFSWETSRHSKTSCLPCHQTPGVTGYLEQKADLVQMIVAAQRRSYEAPILADVSNKSCLKCHQNKTSRMIESLGIRVRHSDFLAKGYQCTQCHNTAGHGDKVANPSYPTMDICAKCHNNQIASARCSRCHVSDIGDSRRAGRRDFPRATLTPIPCNRCHATETCNKCHGVEMPHPSDWIERATHAKESAFEKKEVCKKCHDMDFCNDCHNFPGHGPNFKEEHGKITTRDKQQGCIGCHHKIKNNQDYCGLCHP